MERRIVKNCVNAKYENNKVKLYILDKNIFLEAKNAVEKNGSFVEMTLTGNLLQVNLVDYILLMSECSDNKDEITKQFKQELKIEDNTNKSWNEELKKQMNSEKAKKIISGVIKTLPSAVNVVLKEALKLEI